MMKTPRQATKSSTLLTTQLKKKGLELVPEYMDPALGLGPVFTVNPLKTGTSNSDVSYRLYYAGEASKYSASHRNAVIKAAAKKQRGGLIGSGAGLGAGTGPLGGKTGLKLGVVVEAERYADARSEAESDTSSEVSQSSVSD